MSVLQALSIALGFVVANYGMQFFATVPDMGTAFERSFFQAAAVLACYLCVEVLSEED